MSGNGDKYVILFDNLIQRLSKDETTGEYSLPGVITSGERIAMTYAREAFSTTSLALEEGENFDRELSTPNILPLATGDLASVEETGAASDTDTTETNESCFSANADGVISSRGIEHLLDRSVLRPRDFNRDIKLGLDFGTAYSKACMVNVMGGEESILDLPLGIYAGEDALEMPVHSSLFIDPDGRLYFGPIAVEKSLEARAAGNQVSRIDSIKSFLIDENRVTIDDSPLINAYNPTDKEVSKAALLTFYLGYLLFLVREAARERHGVDISTLQQRISLPCYEPHHRAKVIKEISKLFMFGEVLGKSFTTEWETGFRIEDVMYLYNWMRENIKENSPYIDRFLEEPLAVAGSRLGIDGVSLGNVCMVVDVGAGTTDFTMFEIFADAKKDNTVASEVKGSEYGVPVAGDKLDAILLAYILREAGISRSSEYYKENLVSLRLDIRDYKERLFGANQVTYSLPGGITGQVQLSDFLKEKSVKDFSQQLRKAFVHVLSSIHPSWIKTKIQQKNAQSRLPVILTGGSASLPMVKNLAKGVIDVRGYSIQLFLSPAVPKWIENSYEGEIIDLYPQMAVAIGGAKNFIIEKTGVVEKYG